MILNTREDVFDAVDGGACISTEPWKWGTRRTHVVARDGKHYSFVTEHHTEEGLQFHGPIAAIEVRPVTKTITTWEPVHEKGSADE